MILYKDSINNESESVTIPKEYTMIRQIAMGNIQYDSTCTLKNTPEYTVGEKGDKGTRETQVMEVEQQESKVTMDQLEQLDQQEQRATLEKLDQQEQKVIIGKVY